MVVTVVSVGPMVVLAIDSGVDASVPLTVEADRRVLAVSDTVVSAAVPHPKVQDTSEARSSVLTLISIPPWRIARNATSPLA